MRSIKSFLRNICKARCISLVSPPLAALPGGAAGLPGRQVPTRAERPDGLAARRDPDPAADLLRTCREAAASREWGKARRFRTETWAATGHAPTLSAVSPSSCCRLCTDSRMRSEASERSWTTKKLVSEHVEMGWNNSSVSALCTPIDPDCLCCAGPHHSAGAGDQKQPQQHEGDLLTPPTGSRHAFRKKRSDSQHSKKNHRNKEAREETAGSKTLRFYLQSPFCVFCCFSLTYRK